MEGWLDQPNAKERGRVPNLFEHQADYSLTVANVSDDINRTQLGEGANGRPPGWLVRETVTDAHDVLSAIEIQVTSPASEAASFKLVLGLALIAWIFARASPKKTGRRS